MVDRPENSDLGHCAGSNAAPSGLESGPGITGHRRSGRFVPDKIGQCSVCSTWHRLSGISIPRHLSGKATYDPFPKQGKPSSPPERRD